MWREVHLGEEQLLDILKTTLQRGLDLFFRREFHFQGIDIVLVFVKLEMEVGTCSSARRTNIAYDLSLAHAGAFGDAFGQRLQVRITRTESGVMADVDGSAVTAHLPPGEENFSVAHRAHRRAALGHEIDAVVRPLGLQNRMQTGMRKERTDADKFQGKAEKSPGERATVEIVVFPLAFLTLKVDRAVIL